jgi:hypothetical protein
LHIKDFIIVITIVLFQVRRSKSTGSCVGEGFVRNTRASIVKREDNNNDDHKAVNDVGQEDTDGISFEMLKTMFKQDTEFSKCSSKSSLNDSEDDFCPELFGLLDNPGVVRFSDIDYPKAVTEHSDTEDKADTDPPEWKKVPYDDIPMDNDPAWYNLKDVDCEKSIISECIYDIRNRFGDEGRGDTSVILRD